jgi:NAD(P)-dependent dehydrogenase (short-subunit alcohol dehydrogenase family)
MSRTKDLRGKVVVVTGASAGIGKATAIALGSEKASVALAARRKERLDAVAGEVEKQGGTAVSLPTDVSDEKQVQSMIERILQRFEKIDVLINNAGSGLLATVLETTPAQMEKLWRANFMSTFYCIRSVLPVFRKQGGGHIITVASMTGKRGASLKSAYSVTKFAQIGLMESMRMELLGTNIRSTIVYPGATETDFTSAMENPGKRDLKYYGPVQQPDAVARAIVKAVYNPKIEVITQKYGRIQMILNAVSPGFVDWLVSSTVKKNLKVE